MEAALATGRTLGRARAGKTLFVVESYKIFIPGNILVTVITWSELGFMHVEIVILKIVLIFKSFLTFITIHGYWGGYI